MKPDKIKESRDLSLGSIHTTAIELVEDGYLIPIIKWAQSHTLHDIYGGRNFFVVFALDLGRQDFPRADKLMQNWAVGSLTGSPTWLSVRAEKSGLKNRIITEEIDHYIKSITEVSTDYNSHILEEDRECYIEDTIPVIRTRNFREQDFIIPIPSRFDLKEAARNPNRPLLFFFAGSINSCSRKKLERGYSAEYLNSTTQFISTQSNLSRHNNVYVSPDIIVSSRVRGSVEYRQRLFSSKYCPILRGSSHTNNVRLYDSIVHGCIPVIISDDFHPPFADILNWDSFAIFLGTKVLDCLIDTEGVPINNNNNSWNITNNSNEITSPSVEPRCLNLESYLRGIPEIKRLEMHRSLTSLSISPLRAFEWRGGLFWNFVFSDILSKIYRSTLRDPMEKRMKATYTARYNTVSFLNNIRSLIYPGCYDCWPSHYGLDSPERISPLYTSLNVWTKSIHENDTSLDWYTGILSIEHEGRIFNMSTLIDRFISLQLSSGIFGCTDLISLLPALFILVKRRGYNNANQRIIFIDGGANIGNVASRIFSVFSDIATDKFLIDSENRSDCSFGDKKVSQLKTCVVCPEIPLFITVLCVEPHPRNFEILEQRAIAENWTFGDARSIIMVRKGLGGNDGVEYLNLSDLIIDEVAFFSKEEDAMTMTMDTSLIDGNDAHLLSGILPVDVIRLDTLIRVHVDGNQVFVLKLDIEGLEMEVIMNSRYVLIDHQSIKFIVFEYSKLSWERRTHLPSYSQLQEVISFLWSLTYFCFLIDKDKMWPVSGPFWNVLWTSVTWSNFLCGSFHDPDLILLLEIYGGADSTDDFRSFIDSMK